MPTRHYRMSNRQRKELLIRHCPVLLALPMGRDDDWIRARNDAAGLAADLLPEVKHLIRRAIIGSVSVHPPGDGDVTTLTTLIGAIDSRPGTPKPGNVMCRHEVLLVWLGVDQLRHAVAGAQWPENLLIDGKPIL